MSCLYVVEEEDFIFLKNQTGLSDGNLSSHLSKLEERKFITIKKEFIGKKPHTMLKLTKEGINAFEAYRKKMRKFYMKENRKR